MKGNYQEREPLMKFTPKAAGISDVYKIQQYTTLSSAVGAINNRSENVAFSVIESKRQSYNALS